MEQKFEKVDPDDLGEWYESKTMEKGGGGGGGRPKDGRQGKETREAQRAEAIKGSIANVREGEQKHPESEDLDTGLEAAFNRVLKMDEEVVGLPNFETYIQWVYRRLNSDVKPSMESESVLEFKLGSGPGGQNVNKRETAVRLVHKYTRITLVESKKKEQERNKAKALTRARKLVDTHLDKWKNVIRSKEGETRVIMVAKIRELLKDRFDQDDMPVDKKEAFENFNKMMARE